VEGVEAEGRTVNEATDRALADLGLRREDVEIEVLTEGRPRLLGFRGEPARVRVTPRSVATRPAAAEENGADEDYEDEEEEEEEEEEEDGEEYGDEEDEDEDLEDDQYEEDQEELPPGLRRAPAAVIESKALPLDSADVQAAVTVLEDLLELMGVEADVTPRSPETPGDGVGMIEAVLDVEGDDLGILIGRRGQTLSSLQYVLNLVVSKQMNRRVAFGVDVDSYRRRREDALVSLAKRMAARVRGTGRSVTLEPMPPNERRIVHMALAEDPAVMTVSIGEGEARKVAITPTR
jgi:spoIIIJ-associated protein